MRYPAILMMTPILLHAMVGSAVGQSNDRTAREGDSVDAAERRYETAVAKAKAEYETKIAAARRQLLERFKAEVVVRTRKGDLDGALAIRDRIKVFDNGQEVADEPAGAEDEADRDPDAQPAAERGANPAKVGDRPLIAGVGQDASRIRTGVQKEDLAVWDDTTKPYRLRGEYNVPVGKVLRIGPGVKVICEPDAELSVNGTLHAEGTERSPIVVEGSRHRAGAWRGLSARKAEKFDLDCMWVTDAATALYLHDCNAALHGCVFAGNSIGVKAEGRACHPTLQDCVLSFNQTDGLFLKWSGATVEGSTISYNAGWGVRGEYSVTPRLTKTMLINNAQGGIWCATYDCKVEAHDCVIAGNGKVEVKNQSAEDWDFSGNYWGKGIARAMKGRPETINLTFIEDGQDTSGVGKVRVGAMLAEAPQNCGATITKVGGRAVR